jgi:hypothetical protein
VSDLLARITVIFPSLEGWCPLSKAHTLAASVLALRPDITLEIGIFGGKSFLPLAMAHKEIGKGMVVGIDPWSPAESAAGQVQEADRTFWGALDHEKVRVGFMAKVNELAVQNCCQIHRLKSDAFDPPDNIGILSLDGNHGETSIRDAERYGPKVRTGGLVFLDDLHWSGGSVTKAYETLTKMGFQRLYDLGTGLVLQRV